MKLLSFLGACALAVAAVSADSGVGKPGYCASDLNCPKTYACVSVQTTRDGVSEVKQCLPTAAGQPICTGIVPGLCPSFSTTWGTSFRQISSVCAYILPQGLNIKCITPGEESVKGGVECLQIQDPNDPKNASATVGVIYGCVDFDGSRLLFQKGDKSDLLVNKLNYSAIIEESCVNPKNPAGSTFVCSSQGTCSPNSANSMQYACRCNIGFSGKYCEKIVDNQCYNDGVCGGGSCDPEKNVCTKCPPGKTGDKCAYCDPVYNSTLVCSKHGKCVASTSDSTLGGSNSSRLLAETKYQCQCDAGYSDAHCNIKLKTAPSATTATPAPSSNTAGVLSASIAAVALVVATVFNA